MSRILHVKDCPPALQAKIKEQVAKDVSYNTQASAYVIEIVVGDKVTHSPPIQDAEWIQERAAKFILKHPNTEVNVYEVKP